MAGDGNSINRFKSKGMKSSSNTGGVGVEDKYFEMGSPLVEVTYLNRRMDEIILYKTLESSKAMKAIISPRVYSLASFSSRHFPRTSVILRGRAPRRTIKASL